MSQNTDLLSEKSRSWRKQWPNKGIHFCSLLGLFGVGLILYGLICATLDWADIFSGVGVATAGSGLLLWRSILFQEQVRQIKSANENQTWKDAVELLANEKSASARIGGVETLHKITMDRLKKEKYEEAQIVSKILEYHISEISKRYAKKSFTKKYRDTPYEILHCLKIIVEITKRINKEYIGKKNKKIQSQIYGCNLSHSIINPQSLPTKDRASFFEMLDIVSSQFRNAEIYGISFKDTGFMDCDFSSAYFDGVTFEGTTVAESNFSASKFLGSKFDEIFFYSTNLTDADFEYSFFGNSKDDSNKLYFQGCNLTNTVFTNNKGLTKDSFMGCYYIPNESGGEPILPIDFPEPLKDIPDHIRKWMPAEPKSHTQNLPKPKTKTSSK